MPQSLGVDLFFISFLEYLLFWEIYPEGGWYQISTKQFHDVVKEWHSHLPRPLPSLYWTLLNRSNVEFVAYDVHLNERKIFVESDKGEYFAQNELKILVNDEIIKTIAERKI